MKNKIIAGIVAAGILVAGIVGPANAYPGAQVRNIGTQRVEVIADNGMHWWIHGGTYSGTGANRVVIQPGGCIWFDDRGTICSARGGMVTLYSGVTLVKVTR